MVVSLPVLVVGTLFGLLVVAGAYDTAIGCGSVDPTDPTNYTSATIVNDTPAPVVVDACAGEYCEVPDAPATLAPGTGVGVHASCAATGDAMTSWRVHTTDGRLLGYVAVDTPRSEAGLVYLVSRASPDRRTPTPHA